MKSGIIHLLILKSGNENFYNSKNSLIQLINSHDSLSVDGNQVSLENSSNGKSISLTYSIKERFLKNSGDRSFDIILKFTDIGDEDEFSVNKIIDIMIDAFGRIGSEAKVTLLQHDIYREYSYIAYKEVFDIENELRKFIYQLMAYKVGYDWVETNIPDGVETRSNDDKIDQSDFLNKIYLTDLTKILFKGQRGPNFRTLNLIEQFVRRKQKDKTDSVKLSELEGVLSKSIWDKHFSDIDEKKSTLEDIV